MKKKLIVIVFLLSFLFLFYSCFVSTGKTFKKTLNAISSEENQNSSETDESKPAVIISTNPSDAAIYIDSVFIGYSPVSIDNITEGYHSIKIMKEKYYDISETFYFDGKNNLELNYDLTPIPGYLKINLNVNYCDIYIDNELIGINDYYEKDVISVIIGSHEVLVKKFGYEDMYIKVEIKENQITEVDINLKEAKFIAKDFKINTDILNPYVGDLLGLKDKNSFIEVNFYVTAQGYGVFEVYDKLDKLVFRKKIPVFKTWDQKVLWDGKGLDGKILKDGQYKIIVKVKGILVNTKDVDEKNSSKNEINNNNDDNYTINGKNEFPFVFIKNVYIKSTYFMNFSETLSGDSGLLFTSDPFIIEPLHKQYFLALNSHIEDQDNNLSILNFSIRYGLLDKTEMCFGFSSFLGFNSGKFFYPLPYYLTSSLKYNLFLSNYFASSFQLKFTISNQFNQDILSNYPGFSFSLPFVFILKPFNIYFNIEGKYPLNLGEQNLGISNTNFILYLRNGILLKNKNFNIAISNVLRFDLVNNNFVLYKPFLAGIGIYTSIFSNFYLKFNIIGVIEDWNNYFIMTGVSAGILF